jgi:type III secretion protein J
LVLVLALAGAGCSASVIQGLDESAANESMAALEREGVSVDKVQEDGGGERPTFRLRVPRGDATRALAVLQALDLPRPARHGLAEVYAHPSLVPSAEEDRARFLAAEEGEIATTLETADGIARARVHLVPEEPQAVALPGTPPAHRARAAVFLKTRGTTPPLSVGDVQRLVAASVQGLVPEDVTVVMTPSIASASSQATSSVGPLRVTPSSRPLLLGIFATGLALIAGLAGGLLWMIRRRPQGPRPT